MIAHDSTAVSASPSQGTAPIRGSHPNRRLVPGTRKASSSRRRNDRSACMRRCRLASSTMVTVRLKPDTTYNRSKTPPEEHRSHRESGADRREQDEIALLE